MFFSYASPISSLRYFRPNYWYWEVVIVARKVLILAISVFFNGGGGDGQLQAKYISLLMFCCITLHLFCRPFALPLLNNMETLSLFGTGLVFLLGSFLSNSSFRRQALVSAEDRDSSPKAVFLTCMLVLIISSVAIAILVSIVKTARYSLSVLFAPRFI